MALGFEIKERTLFSLFLKDAVIWGTEYILNAHTAPNKFYCQVRIIVSFKSSPKQGNKSLSIIPVNLIDI